MEKSTKALMTAAFGGLLLAATVSSGSAEEAKGAADASAKKGECHGMNACKGKGECGGDGHGCAGMNECKGKGWLHLTKAECESKGGTFKEGGGHH